VVYGIWGFFFIVPAVDRLAVWFGASRPGDAASGTGILAAGIVLAVMVLPYITAISFDVCRAVPRSQREGALALGSTRWQTIWGVVLPYARPGIVGGCFLALARALGETMAVVMLVGQSETLNLSLFAKGYTIASFIAVKLQDYSGLDRSAVIQLGLVLLLVTIVVNCLARLLLRWSSHTGPRGWLVDRLFGAWKTRSTPAPEPAAGAEAPPLPAKQVHPPQPSRGVATAAFIDRAMTLVLGSCLVVTVLPLFAILVYITSQGVGAINWDFFTQLPGAEGDPHVGLGHAIVGTVMLVVLATVFAVPLGLLAAIFLAEYGRSRLAPAVRFVGELLGGVPSIIVGVFIYAVVVRHMGFSGWAGALALAVMMVPIVMRASEESLKLVPQSLRNASYALGAARWQTVLRVTIPAALPAIITGVFLAMARVAGETAPLLLTANKSDSWTFTPDGSTPYLTYYIYVFYNQGGDRERLAWGAAFVLLALVMLLNLGIRSLAGNRVVSAARTD
jgi:phosphate transport system permease protein